MALCSLPYSCSLALCSLPYSCSLALCSPCLLIVDVIWASADLLGGGLSLLARYMKGSYSETRSRELTSASLT